MIVLSVLILLWLFEVALPDWNVRIPEMQGKSVTSIEDPVVVTVPVQTEVSVNDSGLVSIDVSGKVPEGTSAGAVPVDSRPGLDVCRTLAAIWAAGMFLPLARLVVGRIALWRLWRGSRSAGADWDGPARRVSKKVGLERAAGLRLSKGARVPMGLGDPAAANSSARSRQ